MPRSEVDVELDRSVTPDKISHGESENIVRGPYY